MKNVVLIVIAIIILGTGWYFFSGGAAHKNITVDTDDAYVEYGSDGIRVNTKATGTTKSKNMVVVLDASGSMNGTVAGQKKIDALKASADTILNSAAADTNIGVLVYGQAGSNSEADKAVSCATIDELQTITNINPASVSGKISGLKANGWTPIADSLTRAESLLEAAGGSESEILLISDGIETCGGNPAAVAKQLCAAGIRVDVVGFDVSGTDAAELQKIAAACGAYASVSTGDELEVLFSSGGLRVRTPGAKVNFEGGQLKVNTGDADVFIDEDGGVQVETNGIKVDTTNGKTDVTLPADFDYNF